MTGDAIQSHAWSAGDLITLTTKEQVKYSFRSFSGTQGDWTFYLASITDRNGNVITIERRYDTEGYNHVGPEDIMRVIDPQGRALTFGYDSYHDVRSVTDPLGRVWLFEGVRGSGPGDGVYIHLPPDAPGAASVYSISLTCGGPTAEEYRTNRIYRDERGHEWLFHSDPHGDYTSYEYPYAGGALREVVDPCGNKTTFGYVRNTSLGCITTTVKAPNQQTSSISRQYTHTGQLWGCGTGECEYGEFYIVDPVIWTRKPG